MLVYASNNITLWCVTELFATQTIVGIFKTSSSPPLMVQVTAAVCAICRHLCQPSITHVLQTFVPTLFILALRSLALVRRMV